MNPWIIIAMMVAWGASCGGAYYYGGFNKANEIEAGLNRDERVTILATVASTQASAEAIAKIEVKNVYNREKLQTEVRTNTFYADCKHTPDGLRRLNAALTGESADPPAADSQLPAASTPGR